MEKGYDIEKLKDSENYYTWIFTISNILALKDYSKYNESNNSTDDAAKKGACKAYLSVWRNIFMCIFVAAKHRKRFGLH